MAGTEILFALTNDDAGAEQPERFGELLDFLAAQRIPATFFVVPFAGEKPLDQKPEWLALLRRALKEGHELQLHGLSHADFEFGVPPDFMLDIMPGPKSRWENEPGAIRSHHSHLALSGKIALAKEIFQRALGYAPEGFRSGCLAVCDNMYQVLAEQGLRWSSNLVVNPKGWHYINRQFDESDAWLADVPPCPFLYRAGIIEVPIISEYTWFLKGEDQERHFQLMLQDFKRVMSQGGAFIPLSHYFAMTSEWSTGLRVYERLFDEIRRKGHVRFCTLSDLINNFINGGSQNGR